MDSRVIAAAFFLSLPLLLEAALLSDLAKSLGKKAAGKTASYYAKKASGSRDSGQTAAPPQFTIFFPTDDAFEKIPAETLESLSNYDLELMFYAHIVARYITFDPLNVDVVQPTLVRGVSLDLEIYPNETITVCNRNRCGTVVGQYADVLPPNASYAIDTVLYVPSPSPSSPPAVSSARLSSTMGFVQGGAVFCAALLF